MCSFQPLEQWTTRNVAEWMAALNLYQYAHVFQRHNVDGQALLTLSQDKLQVSCLSMHSQHNYDDISGKLLSPFFVCLFILDYGAVIRYWINGFLRILTTRHILLFYSRLHSLFPSSAVELCCH